MITFNLDGTVIIHFENQEMHFDNIYHLMDAIGEWQRELVFDMMKLDFMPDEAWKAFAEANKN